MNKPAVPADLSPREVANSMWSEDRASQAAGMHLEEVTLGRAVISLIVGSSHVNGLGVCHGGYLFMLADSAMAFASNSANQVALAAAAQIDFLRAARLGDTLVATAVTRSEGKRTGITDVEVRRKDPAGDELIALMRGRTTRTGAQVLSNPA